MKSQTKQCQHCEQKFTIEPEDFDFYQKMKVPAPTFCPDCRLIRRFAWRNERSLYKTKCRLCEKDIISLYDPSTKIIAYCQLCWWSDNWNPIKYGQTYNFNQPFFAQFKTLQQKVPVPALWAFDNENCDYANYLAWSKNCYFSFSVIHSEDICYSTTVDQSRSCFDSDFLADSQFCYENINSKKIYQSIFLENCKGCIDSAFLHDCINCQNCFMSSGLRNKQFVFKNQQYSKVEYERIFQEINQGSYSSLEKYIKEFQAVKQRAIHRFANILRSSNVTGDDLSDSKNLKDCFRVGSSENLKYCWRLVKNVKDAYDISGALDSELVYEGSVAATNNYMTKFYYQYKQSKYLEYCMFGASCSNLFGCISLRNKQYCILNKQYTKQEYEELAPKIIQQMNDRPYTDKKGRVYKYGEFFPTELSPFTYNETVAQEYFPLTKQKAIEQGYSWKDSGTKDYQITLKSKNIPDHIKEVKDDILKQVISCEHQGKCNERCITAFKIIPQELQFYKKMNLPLPRLCPNCRHYQRVKQRNPLRLWHGKCQCAGGQSDNKVYQNTIKHFHQNDHCPNEFETTYGPNRKEIVYCEKCYQTEVA